jgi:Fic family protein
MINHIKFARESAEIEGEKVTPHQVAAVRMVCQLKKLTLKDIHNLHALCTRELKVNWSGKFRTCPVWIGGHEAPDFNKLPELFADFMKRFPKMNSWEAHNKFEKIHPYQDFNGRVGRLIWLFKALREDYYFQRSFLHHYYYSTLQHYI